MARTESLMIPLGTKAPDFNLLDTSSGNECGLEQMKGAQATLIAFICNHCPFVKHINPALVKIAKDYQPRGLSVIAISSNDILQYPEDGPEWMERNAADLGYTFPYLFDETQEVAKAYQAVCTPDFFVFDKNLQLAYRGQLDDSRPGNGIEVTGKDIRESLELILEGKPAAAYQKPSIGCNIKWK
jgi:peroxiredoxin